MGQTYYILLGGSFTFGFVIYYIYFVVDILTTLSNTDPL